MENKSTKYFSIVPSEEDDATYHTLSLLLGIIIIDFFLALPPP